MAKQRRRRPASRSAKVHRAGKPGGRPVSVASRRDQEMGSLVAFVPWHREHGVLPELAVLEQLTAFFAMYAEISGGTPVMAMKPGLIAEFVEGLKERDDDLASLFCACLFEYMHFLRHTGRWSGSDESYQVLHGLLYRGALNENVSP